MQHSNCRECGELGGGSDPWRPPPPGRPGEVREEWTEMMAAAKSWRMSTSFSRQTKVEEGTRVEGRAGREAGGSDWHIVSGKRGPWNCWQGTRWRWGPGPEGQLCRALCRMSRGGIRAFYHRSLWWDPATGPQDATGRTAWFQGERLESYPLLPTFQKVLTPVCQLQRQCFPKTFFY